MDPVDSSHRKSTQLSNPLQTESDARAHLRMCEDAISNALFDLERTGKISADVEKTMHTLSNTRVTDGPKIQDISGKIS